MIPAVFLNCLILAAAIKINYGGEVAIRLNEPATFAFSPSDYSNLVFYSLIYENFFYLKNNGDIRSNIFENYSYDNQAKTLSLSLKDNLSFSNGTAVTARDVRSSLRSFLDYDLASAKKIRSIIKSIKQVDENQVQIELLYDNPGFAGLLTAPELVLLPLTGQTYSGIFYPAEKVPGSYLVLKPNKFYAAGRTYLDSLRVLFYDSYYPDIFLSKPGKKYGGFQEYDAGVYQNIYILFPGEQVGQNARIALYSLLKSFYQTTELAALDSLTAADESPFSLQIKTFSISKIRSIIGYSKIKLYIPNSLNGMENKFQEYVKARKIPIETIYLGDNQLREFLRDPAVTYLLMEKVFNKRTPLEEKIKKIVREMTFSRFNEKYLKLIDELDEVKFLKNEELLLDQVAKIIDEIVRDGFILPLAQERYSLYVKHEIKGIEIDYYGRPLFQGVRRK